MGMAVGIDYSLFIVSRFRSERKAGRPKLEAIAVASDTTGRAVFYAGVTVMLSLVGLMMTKDAIFISLSLGAIIVVFIALVGSLTLLPAMLGVLGDSINRLRVPIIGRERPESNGGGIWSVITDKVLARPGVMATVAAAALILTALPVTSLNLGFNGGSDAFPDAVEGKRALELLEEHFTAGLAQPAYVVVDAKNVSSPDVEGAVNRLIESVDGALKLVINELKLADIDVVANFPKRCRRVKGHPIQLEQVVLNLLTNAKDAIEAHRSAGPDRQDDFLARIGISIEDDNSTGRIQIVVTNSGGKIPGHVMERIFDPFFTTKDAGKGLGLGLSISYGIIDGMGGKIAARNADEGVEFAISLPVASDN